MKRHDLSERLAVYAGQVGRLISDCPDTREARHVRDQLWRSATAPGAHYAEARGAQSRADFTHKIALGLKEARESLHWLRVCVHAGFVEGDVGVIEAEANELIAILNASLATARRNSEEGKG